MEKKMKNQKSGKGKSRAWAQRDLARRIARGDRPRHIRRAEERLAKRERALGVNT